MSFCVQGLRLLKKTKNHISFHRHFKKINAFLPDFQLVIQPFDPIPDVFSNAIIIFWVVVDFGRLLIIAPLQQETQPTLHVKCHLKTLSIPMILS